MTYEGAPLMNTYARQPVTFVSGRGCRLFDAQGRGYLDCLGGIAVVPAGHANPEIAAAIADQAGRLLHVSNLFWSEPMVDLAEKIRRSAGGWGRVFFCNSGAEANECAIKLMRKRAGGGRRVIVCAQGGFHGRTLGALAATGQPDKQLGFEPLPAGFVHAPFNDLEAFDRAIDGQTAGVLVEPVQGERGVIPADRGFLAGLREICSRRGALLAFDEVQTGTGRTGEWWAFQRFGVRPDLFTCAKGLGNGVPVGACVAADEAAAAFSPGDHGTTFGGGALAAAAGCATLDFLERHGCLRNAAERGEQLSRGLASLPLVGEARGLGLMIGAELRKPCAKEAARVCLSEGLVVNAVGERVIRLLPPLVISAEEVDEALGILRRVLEGLDGGC